MHDDPLPASTDAGRRENPFDTDSGYSGQDYHRDREAELTKQDPSGGQPSDVDGAADHAPAEAGKRAHIDPTTGEVHGAGSGAGGGNAGEDYDNDAKGGGA